MKRRLVTMRVAQDDLALSPGKATEVELGSPLDSFGQEWLMASHTVTLLDDGTALLTFVLERRGW